MYWNYPKGDDDKVASIDVAHNKGLNKSLSLVWLMKDKEVDNGFAVKGDVSKTVNHGGFSTTGGVSLVYLKDFYGDSGLAHVTPNVNVNYNKGKVNITGSLNYQFGFIKNPEILPPIGNLLWGGASLSVDF